MLASVQREDSLVLVERLAGVHEAVGVQHVVIAEDTLHRAVDDRRIQDLLQFSNPGQHVVAHVEFMGVVPLDLVKDLLVDLGLEAAIEHDHTVADEPPDLLVRQFDALGLHAVILASPAETSSASARILCTRCGAIGVAGPESEMRHGNRRWP